MAAIGILRPIAGAPILDEIIAAGLQVVVEQMPKGNPGKLADMRGIVDDDIEPMGGAFRRDPVQKRRILLLAHITAHPPAVKFDRTRVDIDAGDLGLGQPVFPVFQRIPPGDAQFQKSQRPSRPSQMMVPLTRFHRRCCG